MNRIDQRFTLLKSQGRKGLVAFLTAGDPDVAQSEADIRTVLEGGADVLELGIPFSDPTADGPVIQAASLRALAGGMTLRGVLEMVRRIRADHDQPIILFGYANLFFRYGFEAICRDASAAGPDGLLIVDLPFEESGEVRGFAEAHGLALVPLVAPTTGPERLEKILKGAGGFIYYIMVTGVTGTRDTLAVDLQTRLQAVRKASALPVAAGFGISSGSQAAEAARYADAVVAGSALIKAAREGTLKALMAELRHGLDARGEA